MSARRSRCHPGVIGSIGAIRLVTSRTSSTRRSTWWSPWPWWRVYLLLAAQFVAWVQVLIYVGAIVVLLLFSLMLTRAPIGRDPSTTSSGAVAIVARDRRAGRAWSSCSWTRSADAPKFARPGTATAAVGPGAVPKLRPAFRGGSVLLLAALIGAGGPRPERTNSAIRVRLPLIVLLGGPVLSRRLRRPGPEERRPRAHVHRAHAERGERQLRGVRLVLGQLTGQVFALFVITVAAAEVGIGLAIVILIYRNRETVNVDEVNLLKW